MDRLPRQRNALVATSCIFAIMIGQTLHDSYKVMLILKCTIMVGMAGLCD